MFNLQYQVRSTLCMLGDFASFLSFADFLTPIVFEPVMVDSFAVLFSCTAVVQVSDSA